MQERRHLPSGVSAPGGVIALLAATLSPMKRRPTTLLVVLLFIPFSGVGTALAGDGYLHPGESPSTEGVNIPVASSGEQATRPAFQRPLACGELWRGGTCPDL